MAEITIDVRADGVAYITLGDWTVYLDNSTGEQIISSSVEPGRRKE